MLLHRLQVRGNPSRSPVATSVFWHPPLWGWIKVNTDGTALGNSGISGCNVVFRKLLRFFPGLICTS